jgi:hypothetical protein
LDFGTSRITGVGRLTRPRARPSTLTAARENGSHRSLVDPKEHGFSEAALNRPLTSRTAVVLELEEGQLRLSCSLSLFAPEFQDFFPGVALAIYDDARRRHLMAPSRAEHHAL